MAGAPDLLFLRHTWEVPTKSIESSPKVCLADAVVPAAKCLEREPEKWLFVIVLTMPIAGSPT
jgi:hypothetical protein